MKTFKLIVSGLVLATLAACGGGGGGGSTSAPPAATTPPAVEVKKTPLVTLPTSYENKIASGQVVGPQTMPDGTASGMKSNNEHVLAGIAYGDFFQDGSYSMVVFSSDYTPVDPSKVPGGGVQYAPLVQGGVYFFKKDTASGKWKNNTAQVLTNQAGCVQVRKLLVADFNHDGKPDVFASCTGQDQGPGVGEYSRVLLSQADGTYTNTEVKETCYCHSATTVDINNDGYPDVVAWNNSALAGKVGPYVLLNNKDGTFTKRYDLLPYLTSTQNGVPVQWLPSYWTMEAIDVNGDGKVDLIFSGINTNYVSPTQSDDRPIVLINDGSGTFANANKIVLPAATGGFNLTVDILFNNGNLYMYKILDAGNGENIASTATGYVEQGVQKINMTTLEGSMIYQTNDGSNKIQSLNTWLIFFEGRIADMDAKFLNTRIAM